LRATKLQKEDRARLATGIEVRFYNLIWLSHGLSSLIEGRGESLPQTPTSGTREQRPPYHLNANSTIFVKFVKAFNIKPAKLNDVDGRLRLAERWFGMDIDTLVRLLNQCAWQEIEPCRIEDLFFQDDATWSRLFTAEGLSNVNEGLDRCISDSLARLVALTEDKESFVQHNAPRNEQGGLQKSLEENRQQMKAVNDLWVLRAGFQEVDALLELGELGQALSSLETMWSKLDDLIYSNTLLQRNVIKQADLLHQRIINQVINAWKQAIAIENRDSLVIVTVKQIIDGISLENVYEAVQMIDSGSTTGSGLVEQLLKSLERNVFDEVLALKVDTAVVDQSEGTASLQLTKREGKFTVPEVLGILETTVQFLQTSFELMSVSIRKRFASSMVQQLSNRTLPNLFPADASELPGFQAQLPSLIKFETFLQQLGWITLSDRDLSHWVDNFSNEWILYRKSHYMDILRGELAKLSFDKIMSEKNAATKTHQPKLSVPNNDWSWNDDQESEESAEPAETNDEFNDESWGWGDDDQAEESVPAPVAQPVARARSTVSSAVQVLADVISSFQADVGEKAPGLSYHVADILALYRALAPIVYESAPSPLILCNDVILFNELVEEGSMANVAPNEVELIQRFGSNHLEMILREKQTQLIKYLSTANKFVDCTREPNRQNCIDAIDNMTSFLQNLSREWREHVPYTMVATSLGNLLEMCVSIMILAIESHTDIAEAESVQLSLLIMKVTALEALFDNPRAPESGQTSLAAFYVPSWIKFQYLNEILQSKLVDISFLYESNALVDFTSSELIALIHALFAESEHRRRAIEAIRVGELNSPL
jgi:centromere/kinetochore protein ZW10